jgi:hypothetical protein
MTTVLIFEHRGLGTAMPAGQAVSASPHDQSGLELVNLWPGPEDDGRDQDRHALLVRSAIGPVAISCSAPRLTRVAHADLRTLTPLLRQTLSDMPYIVGATWVDEMPLWLLDMSRFFGSGAARIGDPMARPDDDGH